MQVFIEVVKFVIGIGVMLYGADLLVMKAEKFGRARRWPQILVGVLVVAVGTSLPEFVVGTLAALQGNPLLAAGNVLGSNITNIGLIVGVAALIGEIKLSGKTVDYDIPLSILPLGVFVFGYILNSTATSLFGAALLLTYIGYLALTAREYEKKDPMPVRKIRFTAVDLLLLLLGIGLLVGGGELTLIFVKTLAVHIGFSNLVIGATLLAFGTSLPELVATVAAVVKKKGQIAVGNVLGSNVFNILVVFATTSIISPVEIPKLLFEIMFLGIISAAFLFVAKTGKRHVISRAEGAFLCALYVGYIVTILIVR